MPAAFSSDHPHTAGLRFLAVIIFNIFEFDALAGPEDISVRKIAGVNENIRTAIHRLINP
jgi:hypothetical protein